MTCQDWQSRPQGQEKRGLTWQNWSPNAREKVIIVNKDAKNKYGEEPGYLMMPSRGGGMYTTTPNNTNLGNSQEFAKFAYYLTKYVSRLEMFAADPPSVRQR